MTSMVTPVLSLWLELNNLAHVTLTAPRIWSCSKMRLLKLSFDCSCALYTHTIQRFYLMSWDHLRSCLILESSLIAWTFKVAQAHLFCMLWTRLSTMFLQSLSVYSLLTRKMIFCLHVITGFSCRSVLCNLFPFLTITFLLEMQWRAQPVIHVPTYCRLLFCWWSGSAEESCSKQLSTHPFLFCVE